MFANTIGKVRLNYYEKKLKIDRAANESIPNTYL